MTHQPDKEPAWIHGHAHEPNPAPPSPDTSFVVQLPDGTQCTFDIADLQQMESTTVVDCYIVSTGHGTSGPFTFSGVRLQVLLATLLPSGQSWHLVDVISDDGFGTRITQAELTAEAAHRPALLAYALNGQQLSRVQGAVRLIVPTEVDDALKQVKWIARIEIRA